MVSRGALSAAHAWLMAGLSPIVQISKVIEMVRNRFMVRGSSVLVRDFKKTLATNKVGLVAVQSKGDDARMSELFSDQMQTQVQVLTQTNNRLNNGAAVGEIKIQ